MNNLHEGVTTPSSADCQDAGELSVKGDTASAEGLSIEELAAIVVDCGYRLHVEVGPGLLESVYEVVLAKMLEQRGLRVRRQVPIPIRLMGLEFDEGFRADLIVEDVLLVELKSVEKLAPVHSKQVLTHLRLLNLPLGLLLNFGAATFKEGCKRIVNNHQDLGDLFPSREPITQRGVVMDSRETGTLCEMLETEWIIG